MKVRVGVDASIDDRFLEGFTKEAQLVRIPQQPEGEIEVDFWVAAMPPRILRAQWPHLKGVRVVQSPWAGVDTLLKLFPDEITLCDARGVHEIPTSEWTVAAILAMEKFLPFFINMQRQGKWATGQQTQQIDSPAPGAAPSLKVPPREIKNPPAPINDVADSTVLIVGYGSIGQAVEARLKPFGARFLRVARAAREGVAPVSQLESLLGQADIVVLTIPLTSETRRMIDAKWLARMKPGALLVNASRGAIVDTDALLRALTDKRIRAALDVTDPEPLPPDHPLWWAPNLLITPHVAGDSSRFMMRAFKLASEQAERFSRGEPLLNVVNGEY
ncbi:MAG: 2-hydroxyacid dehydrogenase [Terriglobales bacterium]|jgi:phosphoglycerate dehydrogenase-like enzyme